MKLFSNPTVFIQMKSRSHRGTLKSNRCYSNVKPMHTKIQLYSLKPNASSTECHQNPTILIHNERSYWLTQKSNWPIFFSLILKAGPKAENRVSPDCLVPADVYTRVLTVGNHLYSLSAYFHCIQPCCDPSPATLVASESQLIYRMRSSPSKVHTRIVS